MNTGARRALRYFMIQKFADISVAIPRSRASLSAVPISPTTPAQTAYLTVTTNKPKQATFSIRDQSGHYLANGTNVTSFDGGVHPGTYTIEYNSFPGYYTPLAQSVHLRTPGVSVTSKGIYRRLVVIAFTGFDNATDGSDCISLQQRMDIRFNMIPLNGARLMLAW